MRRFAHGRLSPPGHIGARLLPCNGWLTRSSYPCCVPRYQVPDGMAGLRVQTCGQLIQEYQLWVGEQRQSDKQALFLPT